MSAARARKYAPTTRLLHWAVGLMVLAMFPIGVIMLQEGLARPRQDLLFILHKNGGVIIFMLVVLRLMWRLATPAPALPPMFRLGSAAPRRRCRQHFTGCCWSWPSAVISGCAPAAFP
jgi:cytochrome b561